jgi:peptidoglycan/xylan/chitin deacetylase (PgdA/CDA1 family)
LQQSTLTGVLKIVRRLQPRLVNLRWRLNFNSAELANAKGARILAYHGVCLKSPLRFNTLFITVNKIEQQLRLYKKHFQLVSLEDFYNQRYDPGKFTLCLTFDDGFANNFKYILPLLEQYEVPATFFVTAIRQVGYDILWNDLLSIAGQMGPSKLVFQNEPFHKNSSGKYILIKSGETLNGILRWGNFETKAEMMDMFDSLKKTVDEDYWLQMTQAEIKTLSRSKWVTIGSHGYFHNDLATLPCDRLQQELTDSKKYLEEITGKEIKAIAFPYGSYSEETITEAKKAGYSQLLATDFVSPKEDVNNELLRERLTINPFISNTSQLHANIRGNYK